MFGDPVEVGEEVAESAQPTTVRRRPATTTGRRSTLDSLGQGIGGGHLADGAPVGGDVPPDSCVAIRTVTLQC